MSSKAKKQSWALHISCFCIYWVPSSPGNWSFWPISHPFTIAQHNLCQSPSLWSSSKAKNREQNFSPTAWTEIYKNLNQHHTTYAVAFMQHSPLCYLPGLLEWMANMVENTLLSWCFAFCKRSILFYPLWYWIEPLASKLQQERLQALVQLLWKRCFSVTLSTVEVSHIYSEVTSI